MEANVNNRWISCLDVCWFPSWGLFSLFWLLDLSWAETSFLFYFCVQWLYSNFLLYFELGSDMSSSKTSAYGASSSTIPLICLKQMLGVILASCLRHYRWLDSTSSTQNLWNIIFTPCGKMELTNLWELIKSLNRTVCAPFDSLPLIFNIFIIQWYFFNKFIWNFPLIRLSWPRV